MQVVKAETVEATIVDLDDLLADDTHDRCGIASVDHRINLYWLRIKWRGSGECRRPAVAVMTIICPEHGEQVVALCRKHLALLRRNRTHATCTQCGRVAVVRDLAS